MNLFKKAIAAFCATAMLSTLAVVPVMADNVIATKTKVYTDAKTYTVKADKSATDAAQQVVASYAIEIGDVLAGDKIDVDVTVKHGAGDLAAIGVYAYSGTVDAYSSAVTSDGAAAVMKDGVEIYKMTSLGNKVTAWPLNNADHGNIAQSYNNFANTSNSDTPITLYNLTAPDTVADNSKVYIVLAAWSKNQTAKDSRYLDAKAIKVTKTTEYTNLFSAVADAQAGDEIKVFGDVTFTDRIDVNKEVTITGVGETKPTIDGPIEMQNSKGGNVTTSNIKYTNFNATNQTLAATGCEFASLRVGGTDGATRVTLTDCAVTDVTTYGVVSLQGTSSITGTTTIAGIKASTDKPQLIVGENASVTGTLTLSDELAASNIGYTLVSGAVANFTAVWSSENYEIANGAIAQKSAPEPVYTDGEVYTPTEVSDTEIGFTAAYATEATSGTAEVEWKIIDLDALKFTTETQTVDLTKAQDGTVKFGIVLKNIKAGVEYLAKYFIK